jgi:hypothetical protein
MRKKLENGEYRSALIMQKDFVLIMQNCLAVSLIDEYHLLLFSGMIIYHLLHLFFAVQY